MTTKTDVDFAIYFGISTIICLLLFLAITRPTGAMTYADEEREAVQKDCRDSWHVQSRPIWNGK